jgi:hypothetical protein
MSSWTHGADWLEKDVKGLSPSTPIVLFAHIPLWAVYPKWGWGTDDAERALGLSFLTELRATQTVTCSSTA